MKKALLLVCLIISFSNLASTKWEECNSGILSPDFNNIIVADDYIYACSDSGQIYISSDNGDNWQPKKVVDTTSQVRCIAVSGRYVFACGDQNLGIYLSTDNGDTWVPKINGLTDRHVFAVTFLGERIFAATAYAGVFVSTDYGETWTQKISGLYGLWSYNFTSIGNNLFVVTTGGISLSTDFGETWARKNNGLISSGITEITSSGSVLYAATLDSGVYCSTDLGENWILKSNGLTSKSVWCLSSFGNNVFAGTGRFYTPGNGVYLSKNNADNWKEFNDGIPRDDIGSQLVTISAMAFNNKYIFVGTDGKGIYRAKLTDFDLNSHKIEWLNQISGMGDEVHHAQCTDAKGNIYVTGISKSSDIDFGSCRTVSADQYKTSMFVAKYDTNGVYKWVRTFLITNQYYVFACHTDSLNNVYITFTLTNSPDSDTLNFGDGVIATVETRSDFSFIVKYNPDGRCLWARKLKGAGWVTTDFCFDDENNFYIVGGMGGYQANPVDFGNNVTLDNRRNTHNFLAKYSTDGICKWAKTFMYKTDKVLGGLTGIIKYFNKNIVLLGYVKDSTDFGDGVYQKRGFGDDLVNFVASYTTDGKLNWVNTTINDWANHLFNDFNIDSRGNIYINEQHHIIKFNNDGTMLWHRQMMTDSGNVWFRQILIGRSDEVYLIGSVYPNRTVTFWDSSKFFPSNYFIVQCDTNDKLKGYFDIMPTWSYNIRYCAFGYYNHCSIDKMGNVYDYGYYNNEVSLPDSFIFSPVGGFDAFLIKYSENPGNKRKTNLNFKSLNGLVLRNSASRVDDFLRLTPANNVATGAAWNPEKVNVRDAFTTEFSFRMTNGVNANEDGSAPGADGIAFVIQNTDTFACGSYGGGIGFEGISNSIAIEFDSYKNTDKPYSDSDGSHIAVFTNGTKPNTANHQSKANLNTTNQIQKLKADGTIYYAKIEYNIEPNKLKIYFDTTAKFINPVLELSNLNLDSLMNLTNGCKAYVGFTSATGTSMETHDILSWTLCAEPEQMATDIDIPEHETEVNSDMIFPNPATDFIEIVYPPLERGSGGVTIKIYNIFGQIVNPTPALPASEEGVRIDVSGFAPGMYFVRIGDKVSKFVKI